VIANFTSLPADGQFAHTVTDPGQHHVILTVTLVVNGESRSTQQDRSIIVS
jgi:hypothetical protein